MTVLRRLLTMAAVVVTLVLVELNPTAAHATESSVGTTAEAWYAPLPICAMPTGCTVAGALPDSSPYPADTLHVGIAAGEETARTYINLDMTALRLDAPQSRVVLTLPLSGTDAGTMNADTAQLMACWVNGPVVAAAGSHSRPPPIDCSTSAVATYVASAAPRFTMDLAPFLTRWARGGPEYGVALVPAPEATAAGATWHLAISGRNRHTSDGAPISATLEYDNPAAAASAPAPPLSAPLLAAVGVTSLPQTAPPVAPASAPTQLAVAAPTPSAARSALGPVPRMSTPLLAAGARSFQYPIALFFPVVLLIVGGYLGLALNRPVVAASH